jgi:hypothetical protein
MIVLGYFSNTGIILLLLARLAQVKRPDFMNMHSRIFARYFCAILSLSTFSLFAEPFKSGFLGVQIEAFNDGKIGLSAIVEGSPAAIAGLEAGNELLFVNGHRVQSVEETLKLIGSVGSGNSIELTIMSGGALKKLKIPLVERPSNLFRSNDAKQENNPPAKSGVQPNTQSQGSANLGSESDYASHLEEAVTAFFQSQEAVYNGGKLSRAEILLPSKMPESLLKRVHQLAKVPTDETIKCVQIANDWHNETLSTYEPHCLAIFTSKAIYLSGTWKERETKGFYVDRVSYKELLTKIKFSYDGNGSGFVDGTMEFDNGRTVTSTSEAVRLLHIASKVVSNAASKAVQNMIVAQKALPEIDIREIKGFGSVRWDASQNEAVASLGVKLDSEAEFHDYSNQTPDEIVSSWSHYFRRYPGIKLGPPLASVHYSDRSGKVWLHFLSDKLKMVEREVSDDIKRHTQDAIENMITKYGAAQRELCDFRMENGGDGAVRFVWKTDFGRVIALCDAWYPETKLRDPVKIDGNEMRLSMEWIGESVVFHPDPNGGPGRYYKAEKRDAGNTTLRKTTGAFMQMTIQLENRNPSQSWPFEGVANIQLVDRATMSIITSTPPSAGGTIKHTLAPYQPSNSIQEYSQAHNYLFELPIDKQIQKPTFYRLVVTPTGSARPIYGDFTLRNERPDFIQLEEVESLFDTLKNVKSDVIADLVPANLRLQLRSIAYSSQSLLIDVAQKETDALNAARAEAAKKEAEEKARVKSKSLNDL